MHRNHAGTKLFLAPPPTANGPLHLGHLSGPFLAAGIAARAARAAGDDVRTLCGLDPHQNYVPARAEALGEPVDEMLARFGGLIRQALSAARMEYDAFVDPTTDAGYRDAVSALLTDLVAAGVLPEQPTELLACSDCGRTLHHVRVAGSCGLCGEGARGGCCEGCGGFVSAANLTDPVSTCCDAPPKAFTATVPVLRLEDYRAELLTMWAGAVIPPRVRNVLDRYLALGLPEIPIAYPTDWGIAWKGTSEALRIDPWMELALGYVHVIARLFDPAASNAAEYAAAWENVSEVWYFLGIDNPFYYATLLPAVLSAAGIPASRVRGMIVNEFYRLDGSKFSTSRDHAIWAEQFLAEQDPAVVRAYLAWDRPDHFETDFTLEAFSAFKERFGAVLDGSAAAQAQAQEEPSPLLRLEIARGVRALRPESFDPSLAVRCALAAAPSGDAEARRLLGHITGG